MMRWKTFRWVLVAVGAAGLCFVAARLSFFLAPIREFVGFGQTPARCEAAYGRLNFVAASEKLPSPQTRGYVKGRLSIIAGFDEEDRAEMLVIGKVLPFVTADLSAEEQNSLLQKFAGGSTWSFQGNNDETGPFWIRADEQAYASYIISSHSMVLMNQRGMKRYIRALLRH